MSEDGLSIRAREAGISPAWHFPLVSSVSQVLLVFSLPLPIEDVWFRFLINVKVINMSLSSSTLQAYGLWLAISDRVGPTKFDVWQWTTYCQI